jgi:hypothetical protein
MGLRSKSLAAACLPALSLGGSSVAFGFRIPLCPFPADAANGAVEITVWMVIQPDNSTIIRVAESENGVRRVDPVADAGRPKSAFAGVDEPPVCGCRGGVVQCWFLGDRQVYPLVAS